MELKLSREELCKQINGKLVKWMLGKGTVREIMLDAIVLAQIEVDIISIKPYDYTPEKLFEMFHSVGVPHPLETYKKPTFCFATFQMTTSALKALAKLKDSEIGSFEKVLGRDVFNFGNPICPY